MALEAGIAANVWLHVPLAEEAEEAEETEEMRKSNGREARAPLMAMKAREGVKRIESIAAGGLGKGEHIREWSEGTRSKEVMLLRWKDESSPPEGEKCAR